MEYNCLAVPQGLIQDWSYFGRKYLFHCLTRLLLWFASASLICVFSFQRTVSAQHIIWNKGNLAAPSVFTSSQLALRCQYSFSNTFHVFLILPNYTEAALNQSKPLSSELLPKPLSCQPATCVSTSTEIGFLKLF